MHPTLDLDFFEIPLYSALVLLGGLVSIATSWLYLRVRYRRAAALSNFLDGALIVLVAGWVGARAYHVATHWDYYVARPDEITQVGIGGMAMRGALIAGFIVLIFYARWRRIALVKVLDATVIGLAIGQAIGWAGALMQGANYGVVSDSQIAMDLPDLYGLVAPRFPLQYAEIILFTVLGGALVVLAFYQPRPGVLFLVYLLVASTANFALGFQRGDETLSLAGLWIDQWIDVIGLVVVLVFWWFARRGGKVGIN